MKIIKHYGFFMVGIGFFLEGQFIIHLGFHAIQIDFTGKGY